jgi:hypothetical protein
MTTAAMPYHSPAPLTSWGQFLADVTGGDRSARDRLQEFAGYLGYSNNRFDRFLALSGPIGESWVFTKVMIALADPGRCVQLVPDRLLDPALRGILAGRKLAFATAHFEALAATHWFADVVAGRPMAASPPGGEPFIFQPRCKVTLIGTRPKDFLDRSLPKSFRRRMVHVHLGVPYDRFDVAAIQPLLDELPAIRDWAEQGLARLLANGRFTAQA